MRAKKGPQKNNAEAAWIILNDPERYAGLPLLWAQAWVKRHGFERHGRERRPAAVERTEKKAS